MDYSVRFQPGERSRDRFGGIKKVFQYRPESDEIKGSVGEFRLLDDGQLNSLARQPRELQSIGAEGLRRLDPPHIEIGFPQRPRRFSDSDSNVECCHSVAKANKPFRILDLFSKISLVVFKIGRFPVAFRWHPIMVGQTLRSRQRVWEDQAASPAAANGNRDATLVPGALALGPVQANSDDFRVCPPPHIAHFSTSVKL